MTLLLIRHGETALNVARVLQPAETPLSARGAAQAEALGQRLRGVNLCGIVAS
ncbi:MAG: histidine phosphatase family protein, partial [Rhizobiales bacterium]|nr:histidine phosphatase family protein [Rhizobacter sp.]